MHVVALSSFLCDGTDLKWMFFSLIFGSLDADRRNKMTMVKNAVFFFVFFYNHTAAPSEGCESVDRHVTMSV